MLQTNRYSHLNIAEEMVLGDDMNNYQNFFRMNEDSFESLLKLVSPYITKNDTKMRLATTPREKLAVNYLATGRSFEFECRRARKSGLKFKKDLHINFLELSVQLMENTSL
ncbi:uncharacterized protein LOC143913045 [Arctopsyche grandis]|uniref:uncharacterized protein LOC143913045 n=1 Tax=Arctopsyche grandis TaxID=121162 RepID=UPI00406D7B9F